MKNRPLVFIADDSEASLLVALRTLEKAGMEVQTFNGGKPLLDAVFLETRKPDLILLDQVMPDVEGLDVMRELTLRLSSPIPTILVTAYGSIPLAVEFMKAGGKDFIQKPLNSEYLLLKVHAVLKQSEDEKSSAELLEIKRTEAARRAFFANISHEIRTPLYAISAFADFAKKDIAAGNCDRAAERIGKMLTASEKLAEMVNDMLDLSKFDAGKMDYSFEASDLSACIRDVSEELSDIASQKQASIRVDIEDGMDSWSTFDRTRISQVLRNLIGNAVKFCHKESEVIVSLKSVSSWFEVSVSNKGSKIPESDYEKVFDRFYRCSSPERRYTNPGTGLGLPIAKEIVLAHGGKIWVNSSDKNTTFTFQIPKGEGNNHADG